MVIIIPVMVFPDKVAPQHSVIINHDYYSSILRLPWRSVTSQGDLFCPEGLEGPSWEGELHRREMTCSRPPSWE